MQFVNPKNDIAFKKIFGNEQRKEILISFLNAVLDLTGDREIEDLEILNPYQSPKIEALKYTMLDIQAKDKRGTTFIVEMQVENTPGLIKRFAYYVAKAYASQIERGEGYTELHRIIFIGILDFAAFQGKPYLSRHALLNRATHEQEIDAFEFVFIELPKFTKEEPELETILEKWIYFLKCAEDWEVTPAHAADTQALRAAYEIVHRFGWSRDELEVYEYWSIREQGEKEAVKEAHDEGRAEGLQEGEQRGRQAALRETARSMLAEGLETALVSKVTGLTVEEVATLLTDNCVNP